MDIIAKTNPHGLCHPGIGPGLTAAKLQSFGQSAVPDAGNRKQETRNKPWYPPLEKGGAGDDGLLGPNLPPCQRGASLAHALFPVSCFLLLVSCFLTTVAAWAQPRVYPYPSPTPDRFYPSTLTAGLTPYKSLCGTWYDDAFRPYPVPFCADINGSQGITLRTDFFLGRKPDRVLYLYFEGLAQRAEVYLNDRLLALTDDPFRPYLVPLPPGTLSTQWNSVTVVLQPNAQPLPNLPHPLLGIHKPVFLLSEPLPTDTLPAAVTQGQALQPPVRQTDSTLVYTPYTARFGYNVDVATFLRDLGQLRQAGYTTLYFAVRPSAELLHYAAREGFALAPQPGRYVAYYNPYPPAGRTAPITWTDALGRPTPAFGTFEPYGIVPQTPINRPFLALVLALPLLLLALWKLADSRSFGELLSFTLQTQKQVLYIKDNKYASGGMQPLVTLVRSVLTVVLVTESLLLCRYGLPSLYIYLEQQPYLAWFLDRIRPTEFGLLAAVTVFMTVFAVLKQLFLLFIDYVFELRDYATGMQSVESLSALPYNLLPVSLGLVLLVNPQPGHPVGLALFGLSLLWYLLRRYWVFASAVADIWNIPTIAIFLYICVLEIAPYLVFI